MRKRVIKLLTGIFNTVADSAIRTDICIRMIGAMDDSDDAVKVRYSTQGRFADDLGPGY